MRRRALALILAAAVLPQSLLAEALVLDARLFWNIPVAQGLSGIEVDDKGDAFVAVSDRGWLLEGRIAREDDRASDILLQTVTAIQGQDGLPVAARRVGDWSDAEGLAIAPDGTRWIGFERWSRVARYDPGASRAGWIKDHPDFQSQPDNGQIEAVAIDSRGRVHAIPETAVGGRFPVYRLDPDGWTVATQIEKTGGFSIVGADFDGDDRLWLLERKLVLGLWWQNRIRRLAPDGVIQTLWTGERGAHGNLEGLAVWQSDDGMRVVCISDNNASDSEITELVEFRLTD